MQVIKLAEFINNSSAVLSVHYNLDYIHIFVSTWYICHCKGIFLGLNST